MIRVTLVALRAHSLILVSDCVANKHCTFPGSLYFLLLRYNVYPFDVNLRHAPVKLSDCFYKKTR